MTVTDVRDAPSPHGAPSRPAGLRRLSRAQRWWIAAFGIALVVRIVVAVPSIHDWDGFVFQRTAEDLVRGVTPYMTVEANEPWIYPDADEPMTQQWYAYPALPMLMFTPPYAVADALGSEALSRLALKLPFIAGDLLCAWLVYMLVRRRGRRAAAGACLMVLFNPLLIWVSSAWGMFDIWMVVFVLVGLLALRRRWPVTAGVAFALAPQVKLFPLLFLPMLVPYTLRMIGDRRGRLRAAAGFSVTTAVLVLPFLFTAPRGYLNQMVLMHLDRPSQGVGVAGIVRYLERVWDLRVPIEAPLLALAAGTVVVATVWGIRYVGADERRLLWAMTLSFAGVLAGSKVVNEQYFVVFLVFAVLLGATAERRGGPLGRRFFVLAEVTTTTGVLVASFLLGFHFLTFVPADVGERYLGGSSEQLVFQLSTVFPGFPLHRFPDSVWTYYHAPSTVAYLVMLPVLATVMWFVVGGLRRAIGDLRSDASGLVRAVRDRGSFILAACVLIAVVLVPAGVYTARTGVLDPVDLDLSGVAPATETERRVGAFYYLWWENPAHDPRVRTGNWTRTSQVPDAGFYSSTNAYMIRHIEQMRRGGIDFAVLSYHLYNRARYEMFVEYAERVGFDYAPMIESGNALDDERFFPERPTGGPGDAYRITDEGRERIVELILSAFPPDGPGDEWLRIDGRPVVFVYEGHYYKPSWDPRSRRELTDRVIERYGSGRAALGRIADAWDTDVRLRSQVAAHHPENVKAFDPASPESTGPWTVDFRLAFHDAFADHWRAIRDAVEERVGPVYLVTTYPSPLPEPDDLVIDADDMAALGVFDNEFAYSVSTTWVWWRVVYGPGDIAAVWERQVAEQRARDDEHGRVSLQTVMPAYDDRPIRDVLGFEIPAILDGRSTYDWTWQTALRNDPDVVLVATWNEFFEGSAIEPTVARGEELLRATRRWSEELTARSVREAGEGGVVEDAVARQR